MHRRPLLFVVAAVIAVLVAVPMASAAINRGSGGPAESRVSSLVALGNAFTYQGRLTDASAPTGHPLWTNAYMNPRRLRAP